MCDDRNHPNALEMEKQLLSAMLLKDGFIVPKIASIIDADDFYRSEHRLIFQAVLRLYAKKQPIDYLAVEEELRKGGDFTKIDHRYLLSLINATFTTTRAEYHAHVIKEKANFRRIIELGGIIAEDAGQGIKSPSDIAFFAQQWFNYITRSVTPSQKASFSDFFANDFNSVVEHMKAYVDRISGFENIDRHQFFSPGLYVIGATPASGKTTFCWQLLEQFARHGDTCIYCSYEMSKSELFFKSLARELFKRVPSTKLTAADIRRGARSDQLESICNDFAASKLNLSILELQDESIDEVLTLLKPFCSDKIRVPIICIDYLQIVPSSKESAKLSVDDSVRKLKRFQRDTDSTLFVISSFNRDSYTKSASFESFKESGNIEYTADVVWALQLNALNSIGSGNIYDLRKKIDRAKKQQPRQIQLKCLKNRQGTNYECFFNYFAAHDCFIPCKKFNDTTAKNSAGSASEINKLGNIRV